jgi:cardiolipin synthase C
MVKSDGVHSFHRGSFFPADPGRAASLARARIDLGVRSIGKQRLLSGIGLLIVALLLAACSPPRPGLVKQASSALPPATDTPGARYVNAEAARHADQSGFRLLTRSNNALMSRISLADHAEHSIDLQYYIFKNDETGRLVAQRLLVAADRGVRVRLLVDDINVGDTLDMLDTLDVHPNIEVRRFNPFGTRKPSVLSKAVQFLLDGSRLNRRMHNKSFIVDGNVAIIGGRNIGNDYFDADDATNFRDLDLIAIGPVVEQASHAFDEYWNCDAAFPVTAFGKHADHLDLAGLRTALAHDARTFAQSDYAQAILDEDFNGATADHPGKWFWGPAALVADQPEKIETTEDDPGLGIVPDIKAMTDSAQRSLRLISPYFIPGDTGTRYLGRLARRGIDVRVLTNSLASNDEPAVFTGYSRYRRELLESGVRLYELKSAEGAPQPVTAGGASSGISLHAKAVVVDDSKVYVGSMNMDPRSRVLNTEMGIVVDSVPLAEAVINFFNSATAPSSAYQVVLIPQGKPQAGDMQWQASKDGKPVLFDHDPDTTLQRRTQVNLLKLLPIESLL